MPRLRRLPALALVALAASAALAFAQTDGGGTRVEVRVWERADDPSRNFVSARAEGGSWADLGTVPVTLDGVSVSGVYRYGARRFGAAGWPCRAEPLPSWADAARGPVV